MGGVSDHFSARAWAEQIIAIAEGRKLETESQTGTVESTNTSVGMSMPIEEGFNAKAWAMMMLARVSRQTSQA